MERPLIVDFETHFYSPTLLKYVCSRTEHPYYVIDPATKDHHMKYAPNVNATHSEAFIDKLLDIGEKRIQLMDQCGVDVQVLSLSEPSVAWMSDVALATSIAHDANEVLAHAIKQYPARFNGFATLAPQDAKQAVKELQYCINELGFFGWLTHSNYGKNKYLDDKEYWPILEAAEAMNVPIYLHPFIPAMDPFYKYGFTLAGPPLGFQFETAMCLFRMILGGVFDEFPRLRIMMGHLGETMPFLMERLDFTFVKPWFNKKDRPQLKRIPSQVLRENIYVTVSGRYYEPALRYTLEAMGSDHVLFASDYPYETLEEGVEFITNANISSDDRNKIFNGNAKTFGIIP
ncbi:MAG: amidohydrolase, partial [Legionellales bacterium]|nr:amidohydrolase [Legionellales bacterium]